MTVIMPFLDMQKNSNPILIIDIGSKFTFDG